MFNKLKCCSTSATLSLLLVATCLLVTTSKAQDYDDENYGPQGGGGGGPSEADSYGGGGGGGSGNGYDDGYAANMPNQYQNGGVEADGSNNSPSGYPSQGGSDADGDYEGDDGSAAAAAAAASEPKLIRFRRSTNSQETTGEQLVRVKRHSKYIGPVYTYVKTDKHAHFKWGVKHKVGKKHHG